MPELPDLALYVHALERRIVGERLEAARVASAFLVRTVEPPLRAAAGRRVLAVRRMGKRIVLELDEELFLVFHLRVAGRFHWRAPGAKIPGKVGLAALDFGSGTLLLTEAGSKRRASVHLLRGEGAVREFDTGGLEVLEAPLPAFRAALLRENHTLKRALTDPRILSGIGNAYSDEILHGARLSPLRHTGRLAGEEVERLFDAARETLAAWVERLRAEAGEAFPEKVTAFHEGMAVHGRFGKPCPRCGAPVQRIVYAENEANYCARCQTGGRLLADRALSRVLRSDWPRSLDELD
ncbi:MAG: formamidopyrimidine-DNA glycosylase [Gemmatimonadetes bacterium]|nr:formamidopyrimidine-DNA glycosylase [Gemmatimonadota bacterium]